MNNNNTLQLQRGEIAVLTTTKMSTGEKSIQRFYIFTNALHWFDSLCEREEFDFEYFPSQTTRENFKGFEAGGVGCDYRVELTIEKEEAEEEAVPAIEEIEVLTIQDFFAPKVLMTFGRLNKSTESFTGDFIVESEDGAIQVVSGTFSIDEMNFNFAIDCSGENDDLLFYLQNFGAVQFAKDDDTDRTFLRTENRIFIVTNGRAYCSPVLESLNAAFDFVNSFQPLTL